MIGDTLFGLFDHAARLHGNACAIMRRDRTVTYAELHERITARSSALSSKAWHPAGVALALSDPQTLLEFFFACAAIGRPAMPLDPAMPAHLMKRLLTHHFITELITDGGVSSVECTPVYPADMNVHENSEFYWGLTSGTTGAPKIFARTHSSWIASFEAAESVFAFPAGARILAPGPLHHSLFLYGAVHALCRGHTLIIPTGQFRPSRLRDALNSATHLYCVPFMLEEIAGNRSRLPDLRVIFVGGDKLSDTTRNTFEAAWPCADLVEFYGSSETSFVSFRSTRALCAPGSVGRVFPSAMLQIRDADGREVVSECEGEIFVSGPMLFSRYLGEPPASDWVSVGDTGFLDEQGCLHLTGRTSRMIKSKGLKINPETIEATLADLPEISRAAVVDLPDPARGTLAVAIVEFQASHFLDRRTLSAYCRERLGAALCPKRFFHVSALPLTPSGKVASAVARSALLSADPAYTELA